MGELALAAEAARLAEWPDFTEFAIDIGDVDDLKLQVRWVMYQSEGAGVILGVMETTPSGELVGVLHEIYES